MSDENSRKDPLDYTPYASSAATGGAQGAGWERATLEKLAFAAINEQDRKSAG